MLSLLINQILEFFSNILSMKFGKELMIFFISALPILESRGALIAASLIRLNLINSLIFAFLGNFISALICFFIFEHIYDFLKKSKNTFLEKIFLFLDNKINKHRDEIEKYSLLGLVLFIGIPLPGTGAITAALIASILKIDKKKIIPAFILGILLSMFIVSILSFIIFRF